MSEAISWRQSGMMEVCCKSVIRPIERFSFAIFAFLRKNRIADQKYKQKLQAE